MANDLWRTPPEVFATLNAEFHFVADMAASAENALCPVFFTEGSDSLSFDWSTVLWWCPAGSYVWLNCPYSDPMPWVKHAARAQRNGLGVVMLLNADCSVGWFAEALKTVSEVRFVVSDETPDGQRPYSSGRLGFLGANGDPVNGNNKPQFFLVFDPLRIGYPETSYIKKSELYRKQLDG